MTGPQSELTHTVPNTFGALLKQWRKTRGLSQLGLSVEADVSSRHLSFVETGRSQPSRHMVVRLSEAMDIPLRERNVLLNAAGYASLYSESELGQTELASVEGIVSQMFKQHEPYSALLIDSRWDILKANRGHHLLWEAMTGMPLVKGERQNLLMAALHPDGLRPHIVNWDQVAQATLFRVRRELGANPRNKALQALVAEVMELPGVREVWAADSTPKALFPVLPLELRVGERTIRLHSAITTIGTPLDATAQELRIESFFPADRETAEFIVALAEPSAITRRPYA
jgi:transcriptional regulator with XRE-family HTH domain